jgi:hypothetical protein
MKEFLIIILMISMLTSCTSPEIKYEADTGFLNSAQANSMEFPIKIKGKVCLDLEGITGLCSVRINSNEDFIMAVDPLEYGYRYKLTCTKEANADRSEDIIAKQPLKITIAKDNLTGLKSFICIGEIFPSDRDMEISARWEVRVKIQDAAYQKRESVYETVLNGKPLIVVGKNALYTRVCYVDDCKNYTKATMIPKQNKQGLRVYSESERMRYNFYKE